MYSVTITNSGYIDARYKELIKINIPIITGENSITYFVDKSSIKSIEEDQSIYKVQAVVYEVENKNSHRLNPYIHKVLVTYRYDIRHTVASILRVPQYSQDYSLLYLCQTSWFWYEIDYE